MDVDVIDHTQNPERTICVAARGDYSSNSMVGVDPSIERHYADVMESVEYDEEDVEAVVPTVGDIPVSGTVREGTSHANNVKTRSLIHQLIQRGHYGVFEHVQITFAVEGISRPCMAQLTRHRHLSFDVQSQRYCEFDNASVRRPPSVESDSAVSRDEGVTDVAEGTERIFDDAVQTALTAYNDLREKGVPKEDARFVLPEGTMVNLTMTANLRSLMHVANLRAKADAQWEIRELTEQLLELTEEIAPYTMEAWEEQTPMEISP